MIGSYFNAPLPSHMFFDLDNTLWDDKHPLIKPAWERLPFAFKKVFGEIPSDFRWSDYKGTTDIDLVMKLVSVLRRPQVLADVSNRELADSVLSEMAKYYYENSDASIAAANFNDTENVLGFLSERGVKLGIISGNDGQQRKVGRVEYPAVGPYKLVQSGLDKYFRVPGLQFWGGDLGSSTRADLILAAHHRLKLDHDAERKIIPPLVYVADSVGDFEGVIRTIKTFRDALSFEGKYDLRLVLRHNGDIKQFRDDLVTRTSNYGRFSYQGKESESVFRSDITFSDERFKAQILNSESIIFGIGKEESLMSRTESEVRVQIVPNLETMFTRDGLVGRLPKLR